MNDSALPGRTLQPGLRQGGGPRIDELDRYTVRVYEGRAPRVSRTYTVRATDQLHARVLALKLALRDGMATARADEPKALSHAAIVGHPRQMPRKFSSPNEKQCRYTGCTALHAGKALAFFCATHWEEMREEFTCRAPNCDTVLRNQSARTDTSGLCRAHASLKSLARRAS